MLPRPKNKCAVGRFRLLQWRWAWKWQIRHFWSVIRFDFLLQLNLVSMEPQAIVRNIVNGTFWNWTDSSTDSKPCPLEVFLLDVNFATYAALRQTISVLHTTTQIEPSGETFTSCHALIKTERQWRNCSKFTPSPACAHDSPPARKLPQCQRRASPLFKLSLILQQLF